MNYNTQKQIVARAKELGIKSFEFEGMQLNVNTRVPARAAREGLLPAIQLKEAENCLDKVFESESAKEVAQEVEQVFKNTFEQEIQEQVFETAECVVEEIKSQVKEAILKLVGYERDGNFDGLLSTISKTTLDTTTNLLGMSDKPNTVTKYRSDIFNDLEREFSNQPDSETKTLMLKNLKRIRDNVYDSKVMRLKVESKTQTVKDKYTERKKSRVKINPNRLIEWSIKTLKKAANCELEPKHWIQVTQALKLLTGRRTSEILSSGSFRPHPEIKGCALFKGQLKKHKEEEFNKNEEFIIPIIGGDVNLIFEGMLWLQLKGKRIECKVELGESEWQAQIRTNKELNKKLGSNINSYCKGQNEARFKWYSEIECQSDWSDKQKPDCTRDIYTQIIGVSYQNQLKASSTQILDFLAQCLGHGDNRNGVVKYDVDFQIDFEDIKEHTQMIDFNGIETSWTKVSV